MSAMRLTNPNTGTGMCGKLPEICPGNQLPEIFLGNQMDFQTRLEANWADWSMLRKLKSIALKKPETDFDCTTLKIWFLTLMKTEIYNRLSIAVKKPQTDFDSLSLKIWFLPSTETVGGMAGCCAGKWKLFLILGIGFGTLKASIWQRIFVPPHGIEMHFIHISFYSILEMAFPTYFIQLQKCWLCKWIEFIELKASICAIILTSTTIQCDDRVSNSLSWSVPPSYKCQADQALLDLCFEWPVSFLFLPIRPTPTRLLF